MSEWMSGLMAELSTTAVGLWRWLGVNKDVAAVLLAIAVPVMQRSGETKDRQIREATTLVSQYQAVFFVLNDIANDLRKPAQLATLPSGMIFDVREGRDLLRRIHALEQRELDAASVIALFRARSLVMTARQSLKVANSQQPLTAVHVARMNANADRAALFADDIYRRLRSAELRLAAVRCFFASPLKALLLLRARKMHGGRPVVEPEYASHATTRTDADPAMSEASYGGQVQYAKTQKPHHVRRKRGQVETKDRTSPR